MWVEERRKDELAGWCVGRGKMNELHGLNIKHVERTESNRADRIRPAPTNRNGRAGDEQAAKREEEGDDGAAVT